MGRIGHCEEHFDTLFGRKRLAHNMKTVGNQSIFEFKN